MIKYGTLACIAMLFVFCCVQAQDIKEPPAAALRKMPGQGNPYREQLYTHLNKTVFVNNEHIWFKIYAVGKAGNRPFSRPHNVYVSLYNDSGNIVNKQVLLLNNGSANGSIYLNDRLPSGTYLFRAYSNWMKNFGDSLGFCQTIRVVSDTLASGQVAFLERKPREPYLVRLAAEGGYLLNGVRSYVAVSAFDSLGTPVVIKGWIRDGHKQVVDSIQTDTSGFAKFDFSPRVEESYTAAFMLPDHSLKTIALPEIRKEGISLRLRHPAPDQVAVTLRTNEGALPALRGQLFYVMIQNEGMISSADSIRLNGLENIINIPADEIKGGTSHLLVYDSGLNLVTQRAFFSPLPPVQAIRNVLAKRIGRDTVECTFTMPQLNDEAPADMSVSILPGGSLGSMGRINIQRGLQYAPILSGILNPMASLYQETVQDAAMLFLDHRDASDDKKQEHSGTPALPLENGFLLKGKIENFITSKAVKNNEVILLSPANKLLLTTSSADGTFRFPDLYLKDSSIVLISAQNAKSGRSGLRTLSLEPPVPAYDHFKPYVIIRHEETMTASDSQQSFKIKGNLLREVTIKDKRNTEVAVMAENQSQLYQNDMSVLFREKLGICLLINLKERRTYICIGCSPPCNPRRPCTVYVDDTPVEPTLDVPPFFQWPPMYLIDTVIWDKKHAKLIVKTKPERKGGFEQIKVGGFAASIPFTPAQYAFETEAEPFQKLAALYWNPNLRGTKKQQYALRFYAPSEIKEIRLQLEGITTEGRLLHCDLPVPVAAH